MTGQAGELPCADQGFDFDTRHETSSSDKTDDDESSNDMQQTSTISRRNFVAHVAAAGEPQTVIGASDSIYDVGLYVGRVDLSDDLMYKLLLNPWRPPLGFSFPAVECKTQRRYFNAQWIDRYSSWIAYSKVLGGALCRVCVFFAVECAGKGGHQKVEQLSLNHAPTGKISMSFVICTLNVSITKQLWYWQEILHCVTINQLVTLLIYSRSH